MNEPSYVLPKDDKEITQMLASKHFVRVLF